MWECTMCGLELTLELRRAAAICSSDTRALPEDANLRTGWGTCVSW